MVKSVDQECFALKVPAQAAKKSWRIDRVSNSRALRRERSALRAHRRRAAAVLLPGTRCGATETRVDGAQGTRAAISASSVVILSNSSAKATRITIERNGASSAEMCAGVAAREISALATSTTID